MIVEVVLAGQRLRKRQHLRVHVVGMIKLDKGVECRFPVGIPVHRDITDHPEFFNRVDIKVLRNEAQLIEQWPCIGIKVDKHQAIPDFAANRSQTGSMGNRLGAEDMLVANLLVLAV